MRICFHLVIIAALAPMTTNAQSPETGASLIDKLKSVDVLILSPESFEKVFYIKDRFVREHVKLLPVEVFEQTGFNYEYCDGRRVFLDNPILVEDPHYNCNGGGVQEDQFPFRVTIGQKVPIYNMNYVEIGTFTATKIDDKVVKGEFKTVITANDIGSDFSLEELVALYGDLQDVEIDQHFLSGAKSIGGDQEAAYLVWKNDSGRTDGRVDG